MKRVFLFCLTFSAILTLNACGNSVDTPSRIETPANSTQPNLNLLKSIEEVQSALRDTIWRAITVQSDGSESLYLLVFDSQTDTFFMNASPILGKAAIERTKSLDRSQASEYNFYVRPTHNLPIQGPYTLGANRSASGPPPTLNIESTSKGQAGLHIIYENGRNHLVLKPLHDPHAPEIIRFTRL
jgi:hypothetical protein